MVTPTLEQKKTECLGPIGDSNTQCISVYQIFLLRNTRGKQELQNTLQH